ncbi:MAG: anthranilate phosphoribosyltransferase [Flavobacteriales bacterium]|nr:anthranilate phosphoribosyltransferase [Flavobacteriales bacterium]MCB9449054.1 anthranilate phosphoribosyltransferase [Flavobacteriales bacterium]
MKDILNRLFEYKSLSKDEAYDVLRNIANASFNTSELAAFLTVYLMRSITVEELSGFRHALLDLCLNVDLSEYDPIDLCGTGGDGKNTFNISTLSSFVVAGAGYKVTKHGNYGVSSVSGSSNVLEHFGLKFTNEKDKLRTQLEKAGICFLHAPLFHPAMKQVGPVRKELKMKTFFNMLGPMVNPAFPRKQIVGVFNLDLARLYQYMLQDTDKEFMIIYALDGYDEVSLTGEFKVIRRKGEQVLRPEDLGLHTCKADEIFGGDTVEEAAAIFTQILEGNGSRAQNEVVIANSGLAIACSNPSLSTEDAVAAARESLTSGKALESFKKLIAL